MLSVTCKPFMLSVVMLNVFMLNDVIAPSKMPVIPLEVCRKSPGVNVIKLFSLSQIS
jgi:hypothetical protein